MRRERVYVRRRRVAALIGLALAALVGTGLYEALGEDIDAPPARAASGSAPASHSASVPSPSLPASPTPLNVYAADRAGAFSPAVAGIPERVYVPNTLDGTIDVIDPKTYKVIGQLRVGGEPHHITPAWDLATLYVDNPRTDRLSRIDPRTGKLMGTIRVASPYR